MKKKFFQRVVFLIMKTIFVAMIVVGIISFLIFILICCNEKVTHKNPYNEYTLPIISIFVLFNMCIL